MYVQRFVDHTHLDQETDLIPISTNHDSIPLVIVIPISPNHWIIPFITLCQNHHRNIASSLAETSLTSLLCFFSIRPIWTLELHVSSFLEASGLANRRSSTDIVWETQSTDSRSWNLAAELARHWWIVIKVQYGRQDSSSIRKLSPECTGSNIILGSSIERREWLSVDLARCFEKQITVHRLDLGGGTLKSVKIGCSWYFRRPFTIIIEFGWDFAYKIEGK